MGKYTVTCSIMAAKQFQDGFKTVRGSRDLKRARGYHYEHKLHKLLARKQFHVWRSPCSGARTLPDLFAVHKRRNLVAAFEVKSTGNRRVEVGRYQVKKLFDFVNAFPSSIGKLCVVAVWFRMNSTGWRFYKVDKVDRYEFSLDMASTWTP